MTYKTWDDWKDDPQPAKTFSLYASDSDWCGWRTLTFTIAQWENRQGYSKSRLYRTKSVCKAIVSREDKDYEVDLLNKLVAHLNAGNIHPDWIPSRVDSNKRWTLVEELIARADAEIEAEENARCF